MQIFLYLHILHLYAYRISCIYTHVIIIVAYAQVSEEDLEYWYPVCPAQTDAHDLLHVAEASEDVI